MMFSDAIFSMILKNYGGLEGCVSPLLTLLYFFLHTFFQVALQSYEDRDNV